MKTKKKESRNLKFGVYFGGVILAIILVSLIFKAFDIARNSKFDGKHRFTTAILSDNKINLLSVSPQEGKLSRLEIDGTTDVNSLKNLSFPVDSYIETNSNFGSAVKSYFTKALFQFRSIKTNLTVVDLIRLSIYATGIDVANIDEEVASIGDSQKLSSLSSSLFIDPEISDEKQSIQVTNSTSVGGLGNKVAKYITNLGGSVVLVNTSQNDEKKSKIFYKTDSYTVKKLSKILEVSTEKREDNSISDITIIIGEDRKDL